MIEFTHVVHYYLLPNSPLQVVSSLPLQMTLYLNIIYFPCWLAVIIIINIVSVINFTIHMMMMMMMIIRIIQVILMVAMVKFSLLNYLYKFVLVTILVAVIIIEVSSS